MEDLSVEDSTLSLIILSKHCNNRAQKQPILLVPG